MSAEVSKIGTLYLSREVLQFDKWLIDKAIAAAMAKLRKYIGMDGYLRPSESRKGDFSLILGFHKIEPFAAVFIGVPSRARDCIIQELYVRS